MNNTMFVNNLIKGKITETVFEMMFRQAGNRVTHFGYEYTMGELIQDEIRENSLNDDLIKQVKNSPDFLITTPQNTLHFIEVKFQSELNHEKLFEMAMVTYQRWDEAWYFVATLEGFYLSPCSDICENEGRIDGLPEDVVPGEIQEEYLGILKKFIRNVPQGY